MNKIWETIKLLVVISFCVYVFMLVGGCANPTKDMTPEQKAEYIAQRQYEREDRRLKERDKLCTRMLRCKEAGAIMMNRQHMGRIGKGAHISRKGYCVISRHDRLHDYQCVSKDAVYDWLRRQGLAY